MESRVHEPSAKTRRKCSECSLAGRRLRLSWIRSLIRLRQKCKWSLMQNWSKGTRMSVKQESQLNSARLLNLSPFTIQRWNPNSNGTSGRMSKPSEMANLTISSLNWTQELNSTFKSTPQLKDGRRRLSMVRNCRLTGSRLTTMMRKGVEHRRIKHATTLLRSTRRTWSLVRSRKRVRRKRRKLRHPYQTRLVMRVLKSILMAKVTKIQMTFRSEA